MKKGQITLFIIIGIVILLVVGLIIYFSRVDVERRMDVIRPVVAKVPQEIQPVYDYMSECIYSLGKEAILKAGERGGFADSTFFYNEFEPTEAGAVAFSPDLVVPFWWHMSSPNSCTADCVFEFQKPTLQDVERELSAYVFKNIDRCDLRIFEDQGFVVSKISEPVFKMKITNVDVFLSGKYHFRIGRGDFVADFEDFYIPFDVDFKQAFDLASELTLLEAEGQFLEYLTKELLDSFGGVDKNMLPPLSGFKIGWGAPVFWIKQSVAEQVQGILSSYISFLRANGVNNFDYVFAPDDLGHKAVYELLYNRQFFIPLENSYLDYSLNFFYHPWWKPYFDLNCNGQLCTADTVGNTFMILFGMQDYNFAYDLSYPVLVQLRDDNAFKGEGFVFQFFLEANVRNNEPLKDQEMIVLPDLDLGFQSIFCNPDQFQSGELTLNIKDKVSSQRIDNAMVVFNCFRDSCFVGEVVDGVLKTRLPSCIGGILSVNKQGYRSFSQVFDSDFDDDLVVDIELVPEVKIKLNAKKYEFIKLGKFAPWKLADALGASGMSGDESVLVVFEKIKLDFFEQPFSAVAMLEAGETTEITLLPGDYLIRINSMLKPLNNLVIPKDKRNFEMPFFMSDKVYHVPEKDIVFDAFNPLPYGGAEISAFITARDLFNKEFIEVRYFTFALDKVPEGQRIVEDLAEFGKVNMYSQALSHKLQPVFS